MATAYVAIKSHSVADDNLTLELYVVFFGSDVNGYRPTPQSPNVGDSTIVRLVMTGTQNPGVIRANRNAAIQSEANRLGINWNGKIFAVSDVLQGG